MDKPHHGDQFLLVYLQGPYLVRTLAYFKGPLLFHTYFNDMPDGLKSNIKLFGELFLALSRIKMTAPKILLMTSH